MASVVLKSVGAAAGNAILPGIGGALLGGVAANLGGVVDAKLGLGTTVTGPRLENLSVQDSRYGAGIPIIYGNARVAGNVIWSTDLIETQHNSSAGGKGGSSSASTSTTTYTYSVHCAVAIGAGPLAGINTIWADSTILYQDGVWTSGFFDGVTIYTGAAGQSPDGFMQSILGSGNVPAYQGIAYVVFDNLQLSNLGNRLPNLTFEIAAALAGATTLSTTTPLQPGNTYQFADGTNVVCTAASGGSAPYAATIDRCGNAQAAGATLTQVGSCLWLGNGHVGATTGVGNCDILVDSDGVHPTQAGHEAIAEAIAYSLLNQLYSN